MTGVVGHRGAMAVCAENTLGSFLQGVRDGAAVIELDVHLSADSRLAVIHDATVDRTAVAGRTTGAVAALTWEELQEVDLGGGQRIPSLEASLEVVRAEVHVEIKAPSAAVPAAELVLREGLEDRVTLTSFDTAALAQVRRRSTRLRLGVISVQPTAEALAAVRELSADLFCVGVAHLDQTPVARLQAEGVAVCGWPVRTEEDLRTALAAGVDLVTADDVAWCRDRIAALTEAAAR